MKAVVVETKKELRRPDGRWEGRGAMGVARTHKGRVSFGMLYW